MSLPPIVRMEVPELSPSKVRLAEQTARALSSQFPSINLEPEFHRLAADHIDSRPTLHCDDLTAIMRTPTSGSIAHLQERARLRAMPGDFVACSFVEDEAYDRYCAKQLGLGAIRWLTPQITKDPHRLAEACWQDRAVRRKLVHAIRNDGLRYIHPHYGTKAIWELALLLEQASHMPVSVIGAPPGLAAFVNDKGSFAALVKQLFGNAALPPTKMVWNKALAADELCKLCHKHRKDVSIKLPSSAGGEGNLVLSGGRICGRTLAEVRDMLLGELPKLGYEVGDELIVSIWEDGVLAAPSMQYWIPPKGEGQPIFEGLYKQIIVGSTGNFAGSMPTKLSGTLQEAAVEHTQVLVRTFQELGYVGRCSFDLLLVGQTIEDAALHFIECNGRWGGTSLPMTFLNQIFGSWHDHPYSVNTSRIDTGGELSFMQVFDIMKDSLFDHQTMQGQHILLQPERIRQQSEVTAITLTESWSDAENVSACDFQTSLTGAIADNPSFASQLR